MKKGNQISSDYGVFTDISKNLNQLLGDNSGRTISRRTAEGFKNFFNAKSMESEAAEFMVHGGMVAASKLLQSKKDSERTNGRLLFFALFVFYQSGK